jgi:hypothetical protein
MKKPVFSSSFYCLILSVLFGQQGVSQSISVHEFVSEKKQGAWFSEQAFHITSSTDLNLNLEELKTSSAGFVSATYHSAIAQNLSIDITSSATLVPGSVGSSVAQNRSAMIAVKGGTFVLQSGQAKKGRSVFNILTGYIDKQIVKPYAFLYLSCNDASSKFNGVSDDVRGKIAQCFPHHAEDAASMAALEKINELKSVEYDDLAYVFLLTDKDTLHVRMILFSLDENNCPANGCIIKFDQKAWSDFVQISKEVPVSSTAKKKIVIRSKNN